MSDLGLLAISQGRPAVAESRFREALAILGVGLGADHPRLVRVRISLAIALHGQARFAEALEDLAAALEIDRQAGRADHPEVGVLQSCRGSTLLALGRYAEADQAFEQALAIFERNFGPDDLELTRPLTSRGSVATREGRYADAIAFHQRALAIGEAKLGSNHPLVAQFLNNIAGVYWNLGALDDAQRYAERAHAIREALLPPTHPELAQSYRSLGILAEERHDQTAAEAQYRKALAAYEASSGPNHPDVAIVLWRLAGLLRDQERVDEALAFAARALAIGEGTPLQQHSDFATNVEIYGTLLAQDGDCDAALAQYDRARAIQAAALGEGHPLVAHTDLMRASALTALGRNSEARALALAVEQAGREHLLLTARAMPEELALDYQSTRESGLDLLLQLSAESDTEPSPEEIAEAWNAVVLSRGLISEEMARRHRAYNSDPIDDGARHAHARAVERYVRLLVEGPSDDPASFRAALDSARVERDRSERALLDGSPSLRAEIQRARAGFTELLAALPRDAALVSFVRYDGLAESGDTPRDDRATAAACTGKSDGQRYLAFLQVGPNAPPLQFALGSAAEIDLLVERWRAETIHPVARGTEVAREAAYARAAADLAARIWVPIRTQLGTTRRLFIVPDGSLHGLAFAALPGVTTPFAIEEGFSFQSLNAERDLLPTEARPAARARFLALADPDYDLDPRRRAPAASPEFPSGGAFSLFRGERAHCPEFERVRWDRLPQTRREVEEVSAIWKETHEAGPHQVEILSGSRASEAVFKAEAPGSVFLHLATHGFFLGADCAIGSDDQRGIGGLVGEPAPAAPPAPGASASESARSLQLAGLVLAGANHRADAGPEVEDGILSAEEIAALDLRTVQLAVLSACDTGLGQPRPGEGLLGLRRALQIAGAQSVVMSLWSIEDTATRAWMEHLYRARFTQERDIPASVAAASLAILADRRAAGRTDHPFYWAAFLASGNWR
ncbi:MAG: CHAT domain-containing protein [Candidatus Eisenbacteria bacterium]|nr:CHAT domain-containing protein [Candidatus Eisenbacteria bacterium]